MSNEAEIINNPDSTPGAVSTGYQAQNTNLVSQRAGLDLSYVSGSGGTAVVAISGPVDVNGVLYNIKTQTILTPPSAGRYYISLQGAGPQYLTPTLIASAGTFDPLKNARYDSSGYRVLNWIIYFDGTTVYASRMPVPDRTDNLLLHTDGAFEDIGEPEETYMSTSGTTWTAKRSKYYNIIISGAVDLSNQNYVNLYKRIWIDAGDVWTLIHSATGTLPNFIYTTSFTNGTTTVSAVYNFGTETWTLTGQDYALRSFYHATNTAIGIAIIRG